jgi:putative acetyltransferase
MEEIIITGYEPKYAPDFKRLNVEWIEKYFTVEEHDLEELNNPDEYIISKGGYILFALYNDAVVGTCALIKTGDREYYLAKIGVTPAMHGKQIGKKLGLACLEKAKAVGARRVWLESNRILIAAISLYRRLGFVEIPIDHSPYARADIRMEFIVDR